MMNKIKKMYPNTKGVATIEFALTIGIFLTVIFMIFELARLTLLSSSWDLAITESVRLTKNQPAPNNDYKTLFTENLKAQLGREGSTTMALFAAKGNVDVDVKYADTIEDVANGRFKAKPTDPSQAPEGREATIALYSLKYDYQFIVPLPLLPASWLQSVFNRQIVVVQEYERSSFRY